MIKEKYLAGIDIGTTGAKTGVFDRKGQMIATGYVEYPCNYPRPNWVEQDADQLIKSAFESVRIAFSESGIDASSITGVSVSSQRTCTIFIDKNGKVLRPMISWQDNRTVKEVEDINARIDPSEYYRITGLPSNTTWILSKILWLQKNEPETWKKVYKVIQLQDYALKSLGAEDYYVDISDAGLFGIWETDHFQWSEKLLSLFQIHKKMLPIPAKTGTQVGKITKDVSQLTGLKEGTPICVGAGDQNSAVVGAGIIKEGFLSVSIGTGGIAIAYLDQQFRDPREKSMVTNHAMYGKWQLEGYQAGAASVFKWFKDQIATIEKAYAQETSQNVFKILDGIIEKIPPGAKGLLFMPYLASATAPRWNPNARGTLIGLTFAHDRACLARSFLEGITLEIKDIIKSMFASGIKIDHVNIIGGATKSSLWNQLQADVYGIPVNTLKITDAAVLGASIFAGVGTGVFDSIEDGVSSMVRTDQQYEPDQDHSKIYEELYSVYCKAYEGLESAEVYKSLAKIQSKY